MGESLLSAHKEAAPKSAQVAGAKGAIMVSKAAGLDGHAIVRMEVVATMEVMGKIEKLGEGLGGVKMIE